VGLPSLVTGPPSGRVGPESLGGGVDSPVRDLAARFLDTYLSDRQGRALSYLIAPGATVSPVGGLRVIAVAAVRQLGPAWKSHMTVAATARVQDRGRASAVFPVTYRLRLVRRDRWYVAGVEGALS